MNDVKTIGDVDGRLLPAFAIETVTGHQHGEEANRSKCKENLDVGLDQVDDNREQTEMNLSIRNRSESVLDAEDKRATSSSKRSKLIIENALVRDANVNSKLPPSKPSKPRLSLDRVVGEKDYEGVHLLIQRFKRYTGDNIEDFIRETGGISATFTSLINAVQLFGMDVDHSEDNDDVHYLTEDTKTLDLSAIGGFLPRIWKMMESTLIESILMELDVQGAKSLLECLFSWTNPSDHHFIYSVAGVDLAPLLQCPALRSYLEGKLNRAFADLWTYPKSQPCFCLAMLLGSCPWAWEKPPSTTLLDQLLGDLDNIASLKYLLINGIVASTTIFEQVATLKYPCGKAYRFIQWILAPVGFLRNLGTTISVSPNKMAAVWIQKVHTSIASSSREVISVGWSLIDSLSEHYGFYLENPQFLLERYRFGEVSANGNMPQLLDSITGTLINGDIAVEITHDSLAPILLEFGVRSQSAPFLLLAFSLDGGKADDFNALRTLAQNPQEFVRSLRSWKECWNLFYAILGWNKVFPEEVRNVFFGEHFQKLMLEALSGTAEIRENCAWYVQRQMKRFSKENDVEGVTKWVEVFRTSLDAYLQQEIVRGIYGDVPLGYSEQSERRGHEAKTKCIASITDHPAIERLFERLRAHSRATMTVDSMSAGFRVIHETIAMLRREGPATTPLGFQLAVRFFQSTRAVLDSSDSPRLERAAVRTDILRYAHALREELFHLLPTMSERDTQASMMSWRCFFYETIWTDETDMSPVRFLSRQDLRAIRNVLSDQEVCPLLKAVVKNAYLHIEEHPTTKRTLGQLGSVVLQSIPMGAPLYLERSVPLSSHLDDIRVSEVIREYIGEEFIPVTQVLHWSTFRESHEQLYTQRPELVDVMVDLFSLSTTAPVVRSAVLRVFSKRSVRHILVRHCQENIQLVLKLLERIGDGRTINSLNSLVECWSLVDDIEDYIPLQHEAIDVRQRAIHSFASCLWAFVYPYSRAIPDEVSAFAAKYLKVDSFRVQNYIALAKVLLNSKVDEFAIAQLARERRDVRTYQRKYDLNSWGFWRLPLDLIKVIILDYIRVSPSEDEDDDSDEDEDDDIDEDESDESEEEDWLG